MTIVEFLTKHELEEQYTSECDSCGSHTRWVCKCGASDDLAQETGYYGHLVQVAGDPPGDG